jgi:small-conductance mechanosensitive channel
MVARRSQDVKVRYRWKKLSTYLAVFLGIFLLARIWLGAFQSAGTYLGLLSAGLAIALKDLLANLAGWVFIIWRRPFVVGDRIQIGETAGDVIDQRIFQFTLLEIGNWVAADQSTGRMVHVPNGQVFLERLANYSTGFAFVWNELPVLVTFESDWQEAKKILQEVADQCAPELSDEAGRQVRRTAEKYMIFYSKLTPIVYTSVEDSGVLLTIRYLCEARRRRGSAEGIWEEMLRRFALRDDIDFAYPTQRFYDNRSEGKPGKGAE